MNGHPQVSEVGTTGHHLHNNDMKFCISGRFYPLGANIKKIKLCINLHEDDV